MNGWLHKWDEECLNILAGSHSPSSVFEVRHFLHEIHQFWIFLSHLLSNEDERGWSSQSGKERWNGWSIRSVNARRPDTIWSDTIWIDLKWPPDLPWIDWGEWHCPGWFPGGTYHDDVMHEVHPRFVCSRIAELQKRLHLKAHGVPSIAAL